jgi:hypothetical protein
MSSVVRSSVPRTRASDIMATLHSFRTSSYELLDDATHDILTIHLWCRCFAVEDNLIVIMD